jgi:hypothetical protein
MLMNEEEGIDLIGVAEVGKGNEMREKRTC